MYHNLDKFPLATLVFREPSYEGIVYSVSRSISGGQISSFDSIKRLVAYSMTAIKFLSEEEVEFFYRVWRIQRMNEEVE